MKIKIFRTFIWNKSGIAAFFDIEINGIVIYGLKLFEERLGDKYRYTLRMPQKQSKDATWHPVVKIADNNLAKYALEALVKKYREIRTPTTKVNEKLVKEEAAQKNTEVEVKRQARATEPPLIEQKKFKNDKLNLIVEDKEINEMFYREFSDAEVSILDDKLDWVESFENRSKENLSIEEVHFKRVLLHKIEADNQIEKIYLRYKAFLYQVDHVLSCRRISSIEDGCPATGWFSDAGWKSMRGGVYSEVRNRARGNG